jgi:peptide/nickel transport system substrate-binding protein
VIDAPGPWGSGPFTLIEGYSSLRVEIGLISPDPFVCTWLPTGLPRSDRVVLEANTDYWNRERGPRLQKVVFRNDVPHAEALDEVCDAEGEIDIVTEVSPADAQRAERSEHARLVTIDAMRLVSGVINRGADDVPLDDVRARRALNLAVDRDKLINQGFAGYAHPISAMTPPYAAGVPEGQEPYGHDPAEAKRLLEEAGWPAGRALRLAATADVQGIAELLADDFRSSLGIDVDLVMVPEDELLAAQRALVEKVLPLPFDVLVHAWFDLSSDAPPAVVHREYFHSGGAFRAGPPIPRFDELLGKFVVQTDPQQLEASSAEIDKFVYDEALAVFLCAPMALFAVNKHVQFTGHAATFELAETEVGEQHWSRRE